MPRTLANRYLVIGHERPPRVLMLPSHQGWALPFVTLDKHRYTFAEPLTQAVLSEFGIPVSVLRCLYLHQTAAPQDYADRIIAVEPQGTDWKPPADSLWIDSLQLAQLTIVVPEHREVLEAWFAEVSGQTPRPNRAPWTAKGWLALASAWIDQQLSTHGQCRTAPIKQVKTWSLSCLLKIETNAGQAFFKATPAMFPTEVSITAALTSRYPDLMPELLGIDQERRWLLMRPFAGRLVDEEPDVERWEAVLEAYPKIQVELIGKEDFLTAAGCLDRRLNVLFERCDCMLADEAFLLGQGEMTAKELAQLRAMVPDLRDLATQAVGIPYSLEHGDLHPRNAACCPDSITLFDWSDACISHPFFTLCYFLDHMNEVAIPDSPEVKQRLRKAYLQPWASYGSDAQLLAALEAARKLSYIHYALSYYCYIVPADDEGNFLTTPTEFLRKLLRAEPQAD